MLTSMCHRPSLRLADGSSLAPAHASEPSCQQPQTPAQQDSDLTARVCQLEKQLQQALSQRCPADLQHRLQQLEQGLRERPAADAAVQAYIDAASQDRAAGLQARAAQLEEQLQARAATDAKLQDSITALAARMDGQEASSQQHLAQLSKAAAEQAVAAQASADAGIQRLQAFQSRFLQQYTQLADSHAQAVDSRMAAMLAERDQQLEMRLRSAALGSTAVANIASAALRGRIGKLEEGFAGGAHLQQQRAELQASAQRCADLEACMQLHEQQLVESKQREQQLKAGMQQHAEELQAAARRCADLEARTQELEQEAAASASAQREQAAAAQAHTNALEAGMRQHTADLQAAARRYAALEGRMQVLEQRVGRTAAAQPGQQHVQAAQAAKRAARPARKRKAGPQQPGQEAAQHPDAAAAIGCASLGPSATHIVQQAVQSSAVQPNLQEAEQHTADSAHTHGSGASSERQRKCLREPAEVTSHAQLQVPSCAMCTRMTWESER